MSRTLLRLVAFVGACIVPAAATAQVSKVSATMRPGNTIAGAEVAQVVVTIEGTGSLSAGATLSLEAPPGFKTEPQSLQAGGNFPQTRIATLQRADPGISSGERTLLLQVRDGMAISQQSILSFTYHNVTITTRWFIVVGLIGVVIGYAIKLLIKIFTSIPAPPLVALGDEPPIEGPLTKFVREHYYAVDFLLTVAIGFLVLAGYLVGTTPPAGTAWPGVLVMGAGIGVLANNDLVARLRPRG